MREILWVAAIAVVAMLLFRTNRVQPIQDPPADERFTAKVVTPSFSTPVVIKFGAEWCGPCREMEGELDRVETDLAGRVQVVRVDVDEWPEWSDHFAVSGIPDTIVFVDGRGVARDVGLLRAAELEELVRPWLK